MHTLSNPQSNWNAPCLKQEYIRWYNIVQEKFILPETKEAHKASYMKGWIRIRNTISHKIWSREGEWENHKIALERFKANIQPEGGNQRK